MSCGLNCSKEVPVRTNTMLYCLILSGVSLAACSKAPERAAAPSEYQKHLQTQLISAKPGDVITIPAGNNDNCKLTILYPYIEC